MSNYTRTVGDVNKYLQRIKILHAYAVCSVVPSNKITMARPTLSDLTQTIKANIVSKEKAVPSSMRVQHGRLYPYEKLSITLGKPQKK